MKISEIAVVFLLTILLPASLLGQHRLGQHRLGQYARADTLRTHAYARVSAQEYAAAIPLLKVCRRAPAVFGYDQAIMAFAWANLGKPRKADRCLRKAIRTGWTYHDYTVSDTALAMTSYQDLRNPSVFARAIRLDERRSRRRLADPAFARWYGYTRTYRAQLPPFRDSSFHRVNDSLASTLAPRIAETYRRNRRICFGGDIHNHLLLNLVSCKLTGGEREQLYQISRRRAHRGREPWSVPLTFDADRLFDAAKDSAFVPVEGLKWNHPLAVPGLPAMLPRIDAKHSLYPLLTLATLVNQRQMGIGYVEFRVACRPGVKPPGNAEAILRTLKVHTNKFVLGDDARAQVISVADPLIVESLEAPYQFGFVVRPRAGEDESPDAEYDAWLEEVFRTRE